MALNLKKATTNTIRIPELTFTDGGAAITDAVCTFTLKDNDEAAVSGADGVSMPHTAAGEYEGVMPDTIVVTAGLVYWLEVTATKGANVRLKRDRAVFSED